MICKFIKKLFKRQKKTDYTVSLPPKDYSSTTTPEGRQFLIELNEFRFKNNMPRLYWSQNLIYLAEYRVQHWKDNKLVRNELHNGFLGHKKPYETTLRYGKVTENATYGNKNPLIGMIQSKRGHRENLLGDYTGMGLCIDHTDPNNRYTCLILAKRA